MDRLSLFCLLVLLVIAGSCAPPSECESLWAENEFAEARELCTAEFETSNRCAAGILAAQAAYKLKRYEEILAWAERLAGSECEADAHYLAAWAHGKLNNSEAKRGAFRQSHARFMKTWNSSADCDSAIGAAKTAYALENHGSVLGWPERVAGRPCEADVLDWAGRSLRKLDRKDEAVYSFRRSAELYSRNGRFDKASDLHWKVYLALRAEDHRALLEAAVAAYESAKRAKDDKRTAGRLTLVFEVLHDVGDIRGARWASDEWHRLAGRDDPVRSANQRGVLYTMEERLVSAREQYTRAAEAAEKLGDDTKIRAANINLLEIDLAEGRLDLAQAHLRAAESADPRGRTWSIPASRARFHLALGESAEAARVLRARMDGKKIPNEWLWRYENLRGMAAEADGDSSEAARSYRRAIEVIEDLQRSLSVPGLTDSLLASKREPYERLFVLETNRSRPRDALAVVERVKGRAFIETLLQSNDTGDSQERSALESAIRRVEGLSRVISAVRDADSIDPLPVGELLDRMGDLRSAVYFRALDRYWLVSVARGTAEVRALEGSADEIRQLVRRVEVAPHDAGPVERLSKTLLPPMSNLEWTGRIHIVADRDLRSVPFAALQRDGRLLVEDTTISFVPSLNALLAIDGRAVDTASSDPVVLGDPERDLPQAAAEAREVAALLAVDPALGKQADSRAFRQSRGASVLHLATHSGLGPGGGWFALADGRFGIDFILRERLGATTVVLASCESAANEGSGLWGALGTAFLATGSRNVVATRWPVDDALTRELVLRFYALGGVDDAPRALASAQQELVERGVPVSDWASFMTLGLNREGETR